MYRRSCGSLGLVGGSVASLPLKVKVLSGCYILCSTLSGFGFSARIPVLGFGAATISSGAVVNFPVSLDRKTPRSEYSGLVSFRWFRGLFSHTLSGSCGLFGTFGAIGGNNRGGGGLGREVGMSGNTAPKATCSGKATETKLRVALCQILPKLDKVGLCICRCIHVIGTTFTVPSTLLLPLFSVSFWSEASHLIMIPCAFFVQLLLIVMMVIHTLMPTPVHLVVV